MRGLKKLRESGHERTGTAEIPRYLKMKGLMRKRSTTAARLQRAFSAKGLRAPNADHQHNNNKDAANNNNSSSGSPGGGGLPPNRTREGRPKRQFIMETPATFTTGVQSQERHLFLFSDLLLVAKARSGGNFKLKEKVRVSEMWLSSCLDDVAEVSKSQETSFVVGWPTTNVIASFRVWQGDGSSGGISWGDGSSGGVKTCPDFNFQVRSGQMGKKEESGPSSQVGLYKSDDTEPVTLTPLTPASHLGI
ncbi:Rho GTPase-activating protein 20 [Chionoecetes opilio]|uniref:Rho GTPase-activating protein 20 n=1 Tax=Chionoecetes opilio TaxID=41210 RepID=A0A8J4Y4V8_CHIOP|nr:Rho GTPase-activating protein 20 [Chionoecetes opilio]